MGEDERGKFYWAKFYVKGHGHVKIIIRGKPPTITVIQDEY